MESLLLEALERLTRDWCTVQTIDQCYSGNVAKASWWQQIEQSGFLDLLLAEPQGGAALNVEQASALFKLMGYTAIPVPLAHTQWVRALLSSADSSLPHGFITIATTTHALTTKEPLVLDVPFGLSADFVLVTNGTRVALLPLACAQQERVSENSLMVQACWTNYHADQIAVPPTLHTKASQITVANAVIYAALMAGAGDKILELTLDYAQQRTQFGRQIGRFQAVQALLTQLAQRNESMSMALQLGAQSKDLFPHEALAMVAASRVSEAAPLVADYSHAVHGAIGVTKECELHIYTRALREWRLVLGADTYWETRLGGLVLADTRPSLLAFLCEPTHGS